ncbi:hypothetical protein I5G67_gp060 [Mycobacterium phage Aminay]|uniref:Uncharacterized protein n=1 Tax=Mycobacterium phage Aminay TaxID=2250291 RepID=A0A345KV45_9CAUD|nr:hypothetical protein I5G67_gp060 [Mycobacterium phage Aminay]AXH46897.1 hypothetical protein SEA_AMINAY_60 [Mycobacterium phage Aminay]
MKLVVRLNVFGLTLATIGVDLDLPDTDPAAPPARVSRPVKAISRLWVRGMTA